MASARGGEAEGGIDGEVTSRGGGIEGEVAGDVLWIGEGAGVTCESDATVREGLVVWVCG